jgi:hypothetical protein
MGFKIKNFYGSQPASVASVAKVASPAKDIDPDGNDRPLTAAQQKAADNKKDGVIDLTAPKTNKKKPYVKKGGKATGNMKDYKIGSKERRAEYEARGWKQDDTTKVKAAPVEPKKVVDDSNKVVDDSNKVAEPQTKTEIAKTNKDTAKTNLKDTKSSVRDARKAERIQRKADKKNARAEKIKKQGGTKVGNALRGIFKKKDKKEETVAKYKTVAKKCACGKAKCNCK